MNSALDRSDASISVRPLSLDEVDHRINYFHSASDEFLDRLGVDRARLPAPEAWLAWYEEDYQRPIERRQNYAVAWELDGRVVGFCSVDRITFGREAFLHLHIVEPQHRQLGLGAQFVRLSARHFIDVLRLERLFSEPNAVNQAPNRTLQRAGFRYLYTHHTTPGPLNHPQAATRWVLESHQLPP
jgi:RimJ/RimL family protein N-acetyltransferase